MSASVTAPAPRPPNVMADKLRPREEYHARDLHGRVHALRPGRQLHPRVGRLVARVLRGPLLPVAGFACVMRNRDDEDRLIAADQVHDREREGPQDPAPSAMQVDGPLPGAIEDAGKRSLDLVSKPRRKLSTVLVAMLIGALCPVAFGSMTELGPSVRVDPVSTRRQSRRARRWLRSARRPPRTRLVPGRRGA